MSVVAEPPAAGADGLAAVKAYLRLDGAAEDATVTALATAALDACEGFTGQASVARSFRETLPAGGGQWRRLARTPVAAITGVEGLPADGAAFAMPVGSYAIDVDANGDGWVRIDRPGAAGRVRVTYTAGLGADWASLPAGVRQGATRLAAHLYTHRDDGSAPPPAAVAALWRPWRRMVLR